MHTVLSSPKPELQTQFGLSALIEFMTVCALLARLSTEVGIAPSIFLALMALALATKYGLLAILSWAAALLAADWESLALTESGYFRLFLVLLIAGSLCTYYHLRTTVQLRRSRQRCGLAERSLW